MTAQRIAKALGDMTKEGRGWRCRCPAHGGVSLNLADGTDGKLLVTCWAGCDALNVLHELRKIGLLDDCERTEPPAVGRFRPSPKIETPLDDQIERIIRARDIWQSGAGPRRTIVDTYLRGRGLNLPPNEVEVIRFAKACPFKGEHVPAMLGILRDIRSNEPCGLHRTALLPNGTDRDRVRGKAMLGGAAGAAIKLTPDENVTSGLFICEGIESGLALIKLGLEPVWAVGSAGGIARFPVLDGIECLTICADNDANGAGQNAAATCAERWSAACREVRIFQSPNVGEDAADLVRRFAA